MKDIATFLIVTITLILVINSQLFSQIDENKLKQKLDENYILSNAGTKFFLTFHPSMDSEEDEESIHIYVSSLVETEVKLELPSIGYEEIRTTIPNDFIVFRLTPAMVYAYHRTDRERPQLTAIYENHAIRVTSVEPIVCYGMLSDKYLSDGYLVLPVTELGTEYVVASFGDPLNSEEASRTQWLTPYTSIIGIYDNTRVSFRLGGNNSSWVPGDDYDKENALKPGLSMRKYLNEGDVWLVPVMGQSCDITGSYVRANKPVAVISGSFCASVPLQISGCDYLINQDLPTSNWGTTFHVAPIAERLKNSFITIFAKNNSTTISRDGIPWLSIARGGGGIADEGYIQRRISNTKDAVKGYTISSSPGNPISVVQYNTGKQDDDMPSDPFMMSLIPSSKYTKDATFAVPDYEGTTKPYKSHLNLIYLADEDGGIPEHYEIKQIANDSEWKKIKNLKNTNIYELWTEERADQRKYNVMQIPINEKGTYSIKADEEFSGYFYGQSDWMSFGFPISGFLPVEMEELNDSMSPIIEYTKYCNGIVNGIIRDTADIAGGERISGIHRIFYDYDDSYNYEFTPELVQSENRRALSITLVPYSVCQEAQLYLFVTDSASNTFSKFFRYDPARFIIEPFEHDFGTIKTTNGTQRREFTITLNSDHCGMVIQKFFFQTSERDYPVGEYKTEHADDRSQFKFDLSELRINDAFEPGETRRFWVEFTPVEVGEFTDEIGVSNISDCYRYLASAKVKVEQETSVRDIKLSETLRISPNPANGNSVNIEFAVNHDGAVQLNMFNSRGNFVSEIFSGTLHVGDYLYTIETNKFPAGTYIIELSSGESRITEKLVIIK